MLEKFLFAALLGVALVILDVFYILSFGKFFLHIFEQKGSNVPKWYQVMNDIAGLFVPTPELTQNEKEKILIMRATSDRINAKRTYLDLKINLSEIEGNETYSSLSEHIADKKAPEPTTSAEAPKEEVKIKPKDIESCQQYFEVLNSALDVFDKNLKGIHFVRTEKMFVSYGDMKQYNLLSKIRTNLVKASSLILKVHVSTDVKDVFSQVHSLFQNYTNRVVFGLDNLMDFIYRGEKRMLLEGQKSLHEAEKYLAEMKNVLRTIKL